MLGLYSKPCYYTSIPQPSRTSHVNLPLSSLLSRVTALSRWYRFQLRSRCKIVALDNCTVFPPRKETRIIMNAWRMHVNWQDKLSIDLIWYLWSRWYCNWDRNNTYYMSDLNFSMCIILLVFGTLIIACLGGAPGVLIPLVKLPKFIQK